MVTGISSGAAQTEDFRQPELVGPLKWEMVKRAYTKEAVKVFQQVISGTQLSGLG